MKKRRAVAAVTLVLIATISACSDLPRERLSTGEPVDAAFFTHANEDAAVPGHASDAGGGADVVEPPPPPPGVFDWRSATIYYVFADRFLDSNPANNCPKGGASADIADFMGGDWAGVTAKIKAGYFKKLGINVLLISGPQETSLGAEWGDRDNKKYTGYHGYWPNGFDPQKPFHCLGTQAELKELVDTAHANGMQVMFDLVMMHVHRSADVFVQHKDWFWTNNGQMIYLCGDNGFGGDNWNTWDQNGAGSNWDGNAYGTRCWFTDYLPHWNFTNAAARDFHVSNTLEWVTTYGIDGFRADAVKHVDISWLEQLRAKLNDYLTTKPNGTRFYVVGETFEGWRARLKWHVDPAKRLDGQYEFATKNDLQDIVLRKNRTMGDLEASLRDSDATFGAGPVMTTFLGSQDMTRVIHTAAGTANVGKWASPPPSDVTDDAAYERLGVAFAVMATNRGAPLIYYGDEIGMAGADDPDNRRMMNWGTLRPAQERLRNTVSTLLKTRTAHAALYMGTRQTLELQNDLWVYSQTSGTDDVVVAINRGDSAAQTSKLPTGSWVDQVGGETIAGPSDTIPARSAKIYLPK